MDTNSAEFVGEERAEAWMQRIEVGEVIKIKGEDLEVVRIEKREITLKLLSAYERTVRGFATFAEEEDTAAREIQRQREKMLKRQAGKRPTEGGADEGTHRRTISDQGMGRRG